MNVPIRYISAGPAPAAVSPQAAMTSGAAMAQMGKTLSAVGEQGFVLAEKIRRIDEASKMEEAFAQMELKAADFSIGLMRREDTENWPKEWATLSQSFQNELPELSPEGKAKFRSRFTDWNTRRTIHLETLAANKTLELANARSQHALNVYKKSGDYEGMRQVRLGQLESGEISTPEYEEAIFEIASEEEHNAVLKEIDRDARTWLQHNVDAPPGYDQPRFAQLRSYAKGRAREQNYNQSQTVMGDMVSGKIATLEEMDAATAGLPVDARIEHLNSFDRWDKERAEREAAKPENINRNVGEFYKLLRDYNPDDETADPTAIRLGFLMDSVPASPIRDQMTRSFSAVRSRNKQEIEYSKRAASDALDAAFEERLKEPEGENISLAAALKSGWLKDAKKLELAGFNPSKAYDIAQKAKNEGDAKAAAMLKANWKDRAETSVGLSPFDVAVADAIRSEDAAIKWKGDPSPEKMDAYRKALEESGKTRTKLYEWLDANSKADENAISKKLGELAGQAVRSKFLSGLVTPRPVRETAPPIEESDPLTPKLPDWQQDKIDEEMGSPIDDSLLPPIPEQ